MLIRALLVFKRPGLKNQFQEILEDQGVIVESVRDKEHMWESLSRESSDLVIVSRRLLPEPAYDTVQILKDSPESPEIIVTVEREDPEDQANLISAGCEVVIQERLKSEGIRDVIAAVIEKRQSSSGKQIVEGRFGVDPRLGDFVSSSPAMQAFMNVVERIATSDSSLLIMGETGVGKERLARAIHAEGRRSEGPFVAVNCGALPESLLESELFGHEEGAFTGATRSRRGWFELSHEGTVFLDEIGEMPNHLQVKLLRVLQDHAFQRIGSETSIHVNVRVMASTNRILAQEVESGHFRRDLYYRLNVISLTIPPLRERREDIPLLIDNYVDFFQNNIGRYVGGTTKDAVNALIQYSWPGNVRELMNVIERAVLLSEGEKLTTPDPYGKSAEVFSDCFDKIDRAMKILIGRVAAENGKESRER